jgi:NADPH-dependent curcumin reductase CurA
MNRRIVLAERPRPTASPASFRLETVPIPDLRDGEVLLRTLWLSLDLFRIKYREDIVHGLENAPGAFLGLLEGRNFGKLVVSLDEPQGVTA